MRRNKPSKTGQLILLSIILSITICAIFLLYYTQTTDEIEQPVDTHAQYDFEPWTFSVLGDTQSHNEHFYDALSNDIAPHSPRMMLHLGDYTFSKKANSLINKVIFRLRGDTELKYGFPMEFHGANGNHGSGYNKAMNDLTRNLICYGIISEYENPTIINGIENYGIPGQYEALNPEVKKLYSYCTPDSYFDMNSIKLSFPSESKFHQQYTFERGGIRFIITGYDVIQNSERHTWVKEQVCTQTDSAITMILTHDPPSHHYQDGYNSKSIRFWNNFIDNLGCENNLKVIFGGHVHRFDHLNHNGVQYLNVSGMFYGDIHPGHPLWSEIVELSDHWIVTVHPEKIDITRYVWNGVSFGTIQPITSIPGEFKQYSHPQDFETVELTYNIEKGANLIGMPMRVDDLKASSLNEQISSQQGKQLDTIAKFTNGSWHIYRPANAQESSINDFAIEEGDSIFVISESSFPISMEGDLVTPKDKPRKGWNLISPTYDGERENYHASDVISDYGKKEINVITVTTLRDGIYHSYMSRGEDTYGQNFEIKPTTGLWILVE